MMWNFEIPEEYYEKLIQEVPLKHWREFFKAHGQFGDMLKGFRPHKIPKKRLQPIILKQLKEDIEFRTLALELWKVTHKSDIDVAELTPEYIDRKRAELREELGAGSLFWLCCGDEREEVQKLAADLVEMQDDETPKGEENIKEEKESKGEKKKKRSTAEISLQQMKLFQENLAEEKQKDLEKQAAEYETQIEELEHRQNKLQEKNKDLRKSKKKKDKELDKLTKKLEEIQEEMVKTQEEMEDLRQERGELEKSLPTDFVPCSIVTNLEQRLRSVEKNLSEKDKLHRDIEKLQEQIEQQKRDQAEAVQEQNRLREKNRQLEMEIDYYRSLERPVVGIKKEPQRISPTRPADKINLPSDAHHYPRRLGTFLDRISKSQYIEEIYSLELENSTQSRVKSIDQNGNIYLLYSDGEKGVKLFIRTSAEDMNEGLYIEEEILSIDSSISKR